MPFILLYVTLYGELVFLPPPSSLPDDLEKELRVSRPSWIRKTEFRAARKKHTIDFHRTIQRNGFHYIYHE